MASKRLTIGQIAKRAGVTAREIRDVVTAAGTIQTSSTKKQMNKANKNIVKQIKEVGTAALTGKKGTSSDQATIKKFKDKPNTYTSGTKRK
jgi:hypothetical protein